LVTLCAFNTKLHFKHLNMPIRRHLTIEEASRAIGYLQTGLSQRQVGLQFNVSHTVIGRLWTRYQETNSVQRRPKSGRPKSTTAHQDRQLTLLAKRNRLKSGVTLNREFRAASGVQISVQTVRNRLHASGLHAKRPAVRPPLTAHHRYCRLQFARLHVNWGLPRIRPVLFTDESRFCLDFNDGRRRVWRQKNERFKDCCVAEHDRFGGGSVMVWAGISYDGCTDLYVIRNGTLTGIRYRDEILAPIVRPFAGAIGNNFILMDDNARPHRARLVNEYLQQETIERMDWPAKSPDLNPIEHAWDILQRNISARQNKPNTLQELENALIQEWSLITQAEFRKLILSFQNRCREAIRARGGHTRY